eukprot:m.437717 g.437717  ORF g.437717 m.437717 type:complete len:252 (+) comp18146_c0_seq1:1923-2678(+)
MTAGACRPDMVLISVIVGLITIPGLLWALAGGWTALVVVGLWCAPFPSPVKRYSAMYMLKITGFKYEDRSGHGIVLPRDMNKLPKKFIIIGEPHTHLWDFFAMQLFFFYYGLPLVYNLVSSKYTRIPVMGWILKLFGAVEVDTSGKKGGQVAQAVAAMKRAETMIMHVPPSGKRERGDHWRSGFYHIAKLADVPLVCAWLDGSTSTFGFERPLNLTGDIKSDMDKIRETYADKRGLVPENESQVRLDSEAQ